MLKKRIKYTDYDGNVLEEDFYFNLTESELIKLRMSVAGGIENRMRRVMDAKNGVEIMNIFSDIIRRAYGVKSEDGRRFMKSDELYKAFEETQAYDILFMELVTDSEKGLDFIRGILPESLANEAIKEAQAQIDAENKVVALPDSK